MPNEEIKIPLDAMFPAIDMTAGELIELNRIFSEALVKKYLLHLGTNSNRELITLGTSNLSDREIGDAHRTVLGRLETINTLLSIEIPQPKENT